ncbi:hypothetical protein [Streptomyces sp. NPDC046197]|uniref:hypothetical protein n=1 Tax=Streptomyces sp. NPDC046197 TaxID=3154337 RepID=UPI0033E217E4
MDELVERLSAEGQKAVAGGPGPSVEDLQRRITEMRYVFIKFPDTRGGRLSPNSATAGSR